MTVLDVIQRSADFLSRKGVDSPRLQIELLLAHVLKLPRLDLYLNFARELSHAELETVRALVRRRGHREPLQQIVGSTSFCGLELRVTPDVLIPRPETEILGERACHCLKALPQRPGLPTSVLDYGTGSGCLAIYIAVQNPASRVVAADISEAALRLARENAARHDVAERIRFVQGNGFEALPAGETFNLIVSNPPYIPTEEIRILAPEVRDHEPRLALDGGPDGLKFYRDLAEHAGPFLGPGGTLLCEFGDGQEAALRSLFAAGGWQIEAIAADLTGRPRIFIARRSES